MARPAASLVDGAAPGRGEQPRAPCCLVAAKARQAAYHMNPRVGSDVLGRIGRGHAQIAQERRVPISPQPGERLLVTLLRSRQRVRETRTDHSAEYHGAVARPQRYRHLFGPYWNVSGPTAGRRGTLHGVG